MRFNGGHKKDRYITDTLGQYFEWKVFCPEVEIGLGTPRDTIRLEKKGNETRLVQPTTGSDLTDIMSRYSERKASHFSKHQVFGFILKAKSPSCGLFNMKVYKDGKNQMAGLDQGRFAKVLQENFLATRWRRRDRKGV